MVTGLLCFSDSKLNPGEAEGILGRLLDIEGEGFG